MAVLAEAMGEASIWSGRIDEVKAAIHRSLLVRSALVHADRNRLGNTAHREDQGVGQITWRRFLRTVIVLVESLKVRTFIAPP